MEKGLIINKSTKYLNDIKKLSDYQIDYINKLTNIVFTNLGSTLANHHELKQFSHGSWKVMSLDVPTNKRDCEFVITNIDNYYRGELRLIYEYTYTAKGELVINLTDCDKHKYKNKHYSN